MADQNTIKQSQPLKFIHTIRNRIKRRNMLNALCGNMRSRTSAYVDNTRFYITNNLSVKAAVFYPFKCRKGITSAYVNDINIQPYKPFRVVIVKNEDIVFIKAKFLHPKIIFFAVYRFIGCFFVRDKQQSTLIYRFVEIINYCLP